MTSIKNIIENKNIIYVPIYSMFNHSTGNINLTCDGNVNRWMTVFFKNHITKGRTLTIFGPRMDICENSQQFIDKLAKIPGKIDFIQTQFIQKSAFIQRLNDFGDNMLKLILKDFSFSEDNIFIAEGQGLVRKLIEYKIQGNFKSKIAYWCPVCQTNKKTRSFFKSESKTENEWLFKNVDFVIVVAKDQLDYLNEIGINDDKIVYIPELIDRELSIFKEYTLRIDDVNRISMIHDNVVYLPFRLSDEGYKIWEIIEILIDYPNTTIFCPNVNGSNDEEILNLCKKNSSLLSDHDIHSVLNRIEAVDSSRDTYYSIIDNCKNVVIPYFEDFDFVMHAAVDELILGKKKPVCKVVLNKEDFKRVIDNEI